LQQQILEIKSELEIPSITFDAWERHPLLPLPTLPARRTGRKAVRSQLEIEASILETCRAANVQHWIMVKARLGYDTFRKHMNQLVSLGMMNTLDEGNKTLYSLSERGLSLLQQLSPE
jgi:predicted transcriptional regulator